VTDGALHKLGEVLRTAREAKGVDLNRVERDTKIRTRYLSALEQGEYRDLPGAVYTKGFLRNYGVYLGLDPEYLIDLFRLESSGRGAERATLAPPPRPIAVRGRRTFVVTQSTIVAVLLTVLVLAIFAYIGGQLLVFAATPQLVVVDPAGAVAAYDGTTYTLRGVSAPGSRITISGLTENPIVTADGTGAFAVTVGLRPGTNVVGLVAFDPKTGRTSATVQREITVVTGPSPSPGAATLVVTAPADGATATDPIAIAGSAAPNASVTVTLTPTAPSPVTFVIVNGAGTTVPVKAALPATPKPMTLAADASGAFSGTASLASGTWTLSFATGGATGTPVTRTVTVPPPADLAGSLVIAGAPSYLEADEDGTPKAGVSGGISHPGDRVTLTATRTLRIRAGNAGAVTITINGIRLGAMGGSGAVVEWQVTRR
jgi:cytoskeletal protein RodZ